LEQDKKSNEEEITIDLSKVKKFFKREKKKTDEEEKEIDKEIKNEEEKIETLEEKKEVLEEKEEKIQEKIEEEVEKVEELKEEKAGLEDIKEEVKEGEEELNEKINDVNDILKDTRNDIKETKEETKEKVAEIKKEKQVEKLESKKEEGDVIFDFKKIKNIFSKKSKSTKEKESTTKEPIAKEKKEEISFDIRKAWKFIVAHKALFILLIPIFFSIYFRAYPIYLPVTDEWAENTVYNNIRGNIGSQISQQYPNLPDTQKNALIEKQFNEILAQQKSEIDQQIQGTSNYFKTKMQDDSGQTYLLAIDPWLAYGYARNYIKNGHWGNEIVNGESRYSLRNGREGQKASFRLLPFMMAINYHVMNIFGEASVLTAAFYIPIILMTLAAIAAFFIGKKYGGYTGALTASIIIGVHAALLNRTAAGFSDTDNIIAFFEMITVMFFVLAFDEKKTTKQWTYILLAGLSLGIYTIGHQSWWHIFDFLLGALFVYFVYYTWTKKDELKKGLASFLSLEKTKHILRLAFGFVISSWVFGSLSSAILGRGIITHLKNMITMPFIDPLAFMTAKQVGIKSVWPNVLTTVAELNRSSVSAVIGQIGGRLLFLLSLIGITILLLKKEKGERKYFFYGVFLAFWYIGAIYAAQSSIRFVAFLVPAFALAIAAFVAFTYNYATKWLTKGIHINSILSKTLVLAILFLIIALPLLRGAEATAKREVPSMNDAWYDSLIGIREDSNNSITTSWWDFGHWFVAVSERSVTFDGGDQGNRIHWAGKSLLTNEEETAIGILRMLNCGQQKAPETLTTYFDNNTVKAINILNKVMIEDRETAKKIFEDKGLSQEEVDIMIEYTHCEDLIDQFYIASDDMIGKAGVWGHFGSWNFTKASMYNKVHDKQQDEGISILTEEFGLEEEEANNIYFEIKSNNADSWVSPWPGYMGVSGCSVKNNLAVCGNGVIVNLTNYETKINLQGQLAVPKSIVYADKNNIYEKKFDGSTTGVSAAIVPDGNGYKSVIMDPLHAKGMFTRLFFFEGHGLECFDIFSYKKSFTGNEIYVYKVDWECSSKAVIDEFKEKEVEEEQGAEDITEEENKTLEKPRKIV